ncbi:XdhC family protein [Rhodobacterales bacterium HKCCA1288]|jgi:xanthine dehydrogenase accessory factor|nr:XdhC /CoxI family-like protein [Rhodobacterales bacterium HKCCA1058]MBF9056920.1 XdhC /CoxI family-like protein [Rhodobacterales bacterium HKCCA1065]QPI86354.1 XdhC family protein [Rhodobacterales bacterium HKCCA1288]
MSPAEILDADLADAAQDLRARQVPFAFATIVRTAGATAAKPGAKALLSADGTIVHGWLGGGCTRGAVKRAAVEALQSGVPQLISVAPEDLLAEKGIAPGDTVDGTHFARNGCPSRGTVDIFIEPCLPMPELVIIGTSPVAQALSTLAPQFHWSVSAAIAPAPVDARQKFIVIATQGQGDLGALKAALSVDAAYVAFVGSGRKFAALAEKLHSAGIGPEKTKTVNAPAGLDLGAVTPEEIALSILAQLLRVRRANTAVTDG